MVDDGYFIISVANIPFSRLNRTEPDLFLFTKLALPLRATCVVYALGLLACFAYLLLTHQRIMILLNRLAILSW